MNEDAADIWQRCLSPTQDHWQRCRQHMRTAALRRSIASNVPLFLAPTIGAFLADEHATTRNTLGVVTIPIPTLKTLHVTQTQGE